MSDDLTVDEALIEADEARKFDDAKLRDSSRALIALGDEVLRLRGEGEARDKRDAERAAAIEGLFTGRYGGRKWTRT